MADASNPDILPDLSSPTENTGSDNIERAAVSPIDLSNNMADASDPVILPNLGSPMENTGSDNGEQAAASPIDLSNNMADASDPVILPNLGNPMESTESDNGEQASASPINLSKPKTETDEDDDDDADEAVPVLSQIPPDYTPVQMLTVVPLPDRRLAYLVEWKNDTTGALQQALILSTAFKYEYPQLVIECYSKVAYLYDDPRSDDYVLRTAARELAYSGSINGGMVDANNNQHFGEAAEEDINEDDDDDDLHRPILDSSDETTTSESDSDIFEPLYMPVCSG